MFSFILFLHRISAEKGVNTMKKRKRIFLLALACALYMTGCGGRKDWSEEKGELVMLESAEPALFFLDREEAD